MVCQMPIDTEDKIQLKYNLKIIIICDYELEWWFNGYLDYFYMQMAITLNEDALTAATGTRISTKSPANECLMSLSFTSKKYCAHS